MDYTAPQNILVTCAKGIAPYLSKEILALGFPVRKVIQLGVFTHGSLNDSISLNLQLRTALRVLYFVAEFNARTPEDLYRAVKKVPWEEMIDSTSYLSVTSSVTNPNISDTRFANLKCKDAIVDRIKEKTGLRPNSGSDRSKSVVFLYWKNDDCAIYLDTSGEPLSRRGYRKIPLKAPMQETLAAALLLAAGWQGEGHFINPMCGSGTLAIEAALIALDKAPGLLRRNFGFMHIKGFDQDFYSNLRSQLRAKTRKKAEFRFILTDNDRDAIRAAQQNAKTAGVEHLMEFNHCDFQETNVPNGHGIVFVNPGYGIRLQDTKSLEPVYVGLGDFFKQKCQAYRGYIFTANLALAKKIGLKTSRRVIFYTADIEARLLEYELYSGSRSKGFEQNET
ncbi:class I SAM-dependent RNA methyltransferase [candidate division KSB1 bacterium]|nr:class I SAM-dependent RNA methyltransferase [candidate division KSB1 bacterium]